MSIDASTVLQVQSKMHVRFLFFLDERRGGGVSLNFICYSKNRPTKKFEK